MNTTAENCQALPAFPYSHRRSGSVLALSPARRPSVRRSDSTVRNGKDIIPLVLKPQPPHQHSQDRASAGAARRNDRHLRGMSIGLAGGNTAATQAVDAGRSQQRPSSMFFDRFFHAKDALPSTREADAHLQPALPITTSTTSSPPTPLLPPTHAASPSSCCAVFVKSQARLKSRVTDLEAERDTKDLTISMLSEQLVDKDQEIQLLRMKLAGLEAALAGDDASVMPTFLSAANNAPHFSSGRDSGLGTASSVSSALSSSGKSQSSPRSERHHGFDSDVPYDDLLGENVALKQEVMRLNGALEDGLGALAELGV